MKGLCCKHGESEFYSDSNKNAYCSRCATEIINPWGSLTKMVSNWKPKPSIWESLLPIQKMPPAAVVLYSREPTVLESFSPELEDIYKLVAEEKNDLAIDILFDLVDGILASEKFNRVDDLIREIDLDQLNTNLMVGLLCITSAAKDKLSERASLVEHIEARFRITDLERIEGLMQGLR